MENTGANFDAGPGKRAFVRQYRLELAFAFGLTACGSWPVESTKQPEELIAAGRYGDARGVVVSAQSPEQEDGTLLVLEGRAWLLERDLV